MPIVTTAGAEERPQASKHQPIRVLGGRDKNGGEGRSPRHYQEYVPTEGMYVMYENEDIGNTKTKGEGWKCVLTSDLNFYCVHVKAYFAAAVHLFMIMSFPVLYVLVTMVTLE